MEITDSVIKRFWKYVNVGTRNECWEWTGAKTSNGYGVLSVHSRPVYAHRLSWMISNGDIQSGKCVCHHCDNPSCVNPHHLFIGSYRDNTLDMCKKGRHGFHIVSGDANVVLIRRMYATGMFSVEQLAAEFGLANWNIRSRVTGCLKEYPTRIRPKRFIIDGLKLRAIRETVGVRQIDIEQAVGLAETMISKYEAKSPGVRYQTALGIAQYLNVKVSDICQIL